jgi:hypothetical protein
LKDGKVIQTGMWVVSPDGKTLTASRAVQFSLLEVQANR